MSDLKRVLNRIEMLRAKLERMIDGNTSLDDCKTLHASRRLDAALNEYSRLMHGRSKGSACTEQGRSI